nr:hypothetical protein 2 [Ginkgo biloba tombusvirus]
MVRVALRNVRNLVRAVFNAWLGMPNASNAICAHFRLCGPGMSSGTITRDRSLSAIRRRLSGYLLVELAVSMGIYRHSLKLSCTMLLINLIRVRASYNPGHQYSTSKLGDFSDRWRS